MKVNEYYSIFVQIRNKILALISFAIKNNVNVISQKLYNDDTKIMNNSRYFNQGVDFFSTEQRKTIYKKDWWDNNFLLSNLSPNDLTLPQKLEKLTTIFELYNTIYSYKEMPLEMVFLNLTQATDTLHSRFYCDDNLELKTYMNRIKRQYKTYLEYDEYKRMLLSAERQLNTNKHGDYVSNFVVLYSRLNELIFDNHSRVFYDFYASKENENEFISKIITTRNYYTHYPINKKDKILDEHGLTNAIKFLSCLLEYHVCKILGIDKSPTTREKIHQIAIDIKQ